MTRTYTDKYRCICYRWRTNGQHDMVNLRLGRRSDYSKALPPLSSFAPMLFNALSLFPWSFGSWQLLTYKKHTGGCSIKSVLQVCISHDLHPVAARTTTDCWRRSPTYVDDSRQLKYAHARFPCNRMQSRDSWRLRYTPALKPDLVRQRLELKPNNMDANYRKPLSPNTYIIAITVRVNEMFFFNIKA